jgi:cytochrome c5
VAEQQDKAFVRTFIGVIAILVVITVALIILASATGVGNIEEERAQLERDRAVQRLMPVAAVRLSGEPMPESVQPKAEAAGAGPQSAEDVVAQVCAGCHTPGVMGAPKIGAAGDWQSRMDGGLQQLVQNAITGIGAMPPKGGNPNLTDEQVREAVILMLQDSGVQVPQQ